MIEEIHRTFWGHVRRIFLRGIVLIIPLGLTYWFFQALLNGIDGVFSPILTDVIGRHVPGLGFLTMLALIFIVGLLTRNLAGRLLFNAVENLLQQIPFVRSVYSAIKDLVNAFNVGGKGQAFRRVIMFEYPRKGLYCLGFVTNESHYAGPPAVGLYHVYIPNPPNPTSGVLCLVPKEEAIELDITVEDGVKLVLSGGIVSPDILRRQKEVQS
jgi:uncharacterized membrane protein